MNAVELKKWFKSNLNLDVYVRKCVPGARYVMIAVAQVTNKIDHREPMRFRGEFPEWLGNMCMRVIYNESESLSVQNWGGNVSRHLIHLSYDDLLKVVKMAEDHLHPVAV